MNEEVERLIGEGEDLDDEALVFDGYRPPKGHLETLDPSNFVIPGQENLTKAELAKAAAALHAYRVRKSRVDFGAFVEYCFIDDRTRQPFRQQWFHDDWARYLSTEKRCIIVAPRNHGKTSQVVARTIWEIGRNPDLRIKIACAADGRAKERLFEIVQHIVHNPRIKEVFPDLMPAETGEWSKHKIIVKRKARHRDASIEALGITATATGGRADLLIADDVVDRRNALSFPKLRDQIKQAWKADWTNLLEPDSRVWYICTLWHKGDLSHELMENPAYKVHFYGIPDDYRSMWPEKWPATVLKRRRDEIGSIEFNRGFKNRVRDEDSKVIDDSWIKFRDLSKSDVFSDPEKMRRLVFFTSYDTAVSVEEDADYSACVVIAVDPEDGVIYIVDAWHGKYSVDQQSKQVWRDFLKYRPERIFIEKIGQAVLDEWAINDHPNLAGYIEVTKPKVNKVQRLLAVTPLFEQGKVVFSSALNPESERWFPGRENLIHELSDFPFAKNDDLVDALSQALTGARGYLLDVDAMGLENTRNGSRENDGAQEYLF